MNKPAHPFFRIAAAFTDWILPIPLFLLLIQYAAAASDLKMLLNRLLLLIALWALPAIMYVVLKAYLTGKTGYSIGKWLWGIKVTDPAENQIGMKRAFFRTYIGQFISAPLFGLGYWWILRDPRHRGWHDLASQTEVHRTNTNRWLFGLACIIVVAFLNFRIIGKIGYELRVHGYLYRDMLLDLQKEINKAKPEDHNADQDMIVPTKQSPEI